VRRSHAPLPRDHLIGQPPPGAMPCQASPPPMPCCTWGGGLFCTCGGGSFESPPLLLGAGDDATGSLAGWIVAGLFVVGARAIEGSLTAMAGVALFFSDLFVFRLFPCAPPAATGGTAGAADTAWGECRNESPPSVPEDRNPTLTSTGARTAIARGPQSRRPPREFKTAAVPGSTLSAVASRISVSKLGGRPSSMPAMLGWLVSILAARSSWLSPSPARRTATSRPKTSPPLIPDLLPASTDLGQEATRGLASTVEDNHLLRN